MDNPCFHFCLAYLNYELTLEDSNRKLFTMYFCFNFYHTTELTDTSCITCLIKIISNSEKKDRICV